MTFTREDVELIERQTAWQGYYRMDVYRLRYRLFQGGWSGEVRREVFERGVAAAVVPYDPLRDEVVLIRQFRPGAYAAGMTPWLWEIVAGIIEPGETPLEVVTREAREEAALSIRQPIKICHYLVSPGGTSETCTLFCARVDASQAGGVHGLAAEDEDIEVSVVPSRASRRCWKPMPSTTPRRSSDCSGWSSIASGCDGTGGNTATWRGIKEPI